jgi:hypothetical protein
MPLWVILLLRVLSRRVLRYDKAWTSRLLEIIPGTGGVSPDTALRELVRS